MKKVVKIAGALLLALLILVFGFGYSNLRDRHRGYGLDLRVENRHPGMLRAGFAAVPITPEYMEPWNDLDGNARFEPHKGDSYQDLNGNGKFDTYWIAGFGNRVAAQGVHDDIWARAMVLDDGTTRLALVALDLIGMFHPTVIDIRKMIPEDAGITYLMIASTHTHEAPDMLGLWGESPFKSGVNREWREYVKERVVESVVEAVNAMRPAHLRFSQNLTEGRVTLKDTREPHVYDDGLRMMQVIDAESSETLGTMIQWANHPETLWSRNLQISSDFPHYLREAVEKGVYLGDSLVRKGVGGVALYVNGAVGGLMTTHASMEVKDPLRDTVYLEPSFDKIRAQGDTLGLIILRTMEENSIEVKEAAINLRAKTFNLPLKNPLFRLAAAIGVMDADMTGWMKKRTEVAVWSIGPASFITFPGELYPEILNGGVEALPGRDFPVEALEVPPLRELMPGSFRFGIGLVNDEIGYIIPKSQWDVKEPYVYRDKPYYGEENSLGPETAPLLYRELRQLLEELPGSPAYPTQTEQAKNAILQRIITNVPSGELNELTHQQLLAMISEEERAIFANDHWRFTVDAPAMVSVMRHKEQQIVPFWLEEKGFRNTGMTLSNGNYEYEVWQKEYPAGEITLGINGFDLHRVVYFVTIGPVKGGVMPKIVSHSPERWRVVRMEKGAYTYNDWDELVIERLPAELEGHLLFTTIRGRAREAAILNAFRKTAYPASSAADQVVLTWCDDPRTTQAFQWRSDTSVTRMTLKYRKADGNDSDFSEIAASYRLLADNYIYNCPVVKHWEVNVERLQPDTKYQYRICNGDTGGETPLYTFRTAPQGESPFRFIYLGDTHNSDIVEKVVDQAFRTAPDAAFLLHSGDHVNTGLFRELWDEHFHYMRKVLPYLSFVPALGNHDSQDGLPPALYQHFFMLPRDNGTVLEPERNYAFTYGNSRFLILDSTGDVGRIASWLEEELKKAEERWKIVVTHFPIYWKDDSYPDMREKWASLFDRYGVDLVLSGHVHQYFRSYPVVGNIPRKPEEKGTVYVASVAVASRDLEPSSEKYNALHVNTGALYQTVEVESRQIHVVSRNLDGDKIDEFIIRKGVGAKP
ncbi:3',5'-cyclic AMP phosphodiesterase CpdA [Porphyromonadaceae bacterium KHP3R9]|nr:3',5'-cyclic AMP phosphodiesterase CpdA [Porphyromonadaceae bacterium KHP3R9]